MNKLSKNFLIYLKNKIDHKLNNANIENHNLSVIELYDILGGQTFHNVKLDLLNEEKIELLEKWPIFKSEYLSNLKIKLKGIQGENEVLNQIKLFNSSNSICLHNAYFKNSSVTAKELDFILITPYAIFIIESKYRSCNTIKFSGYKYYENYSDEEINQNNPIFQLLIQKNYLQELLVNYGYNIPVYEFLVFSGSANLLKNQTLPMNAKHICKSNELCNLLTATCTNLKKKYDYNKINEISDYIQKQCSFPEYMFLPKKDDFTVPQFYHLSECCNLPMIPRHSHENRHFFLICPERKKVNGNWKHEDRTLETIYF